MGLISEISGRKKICEENFSSELSSPVFGGAPNPHPCLSCQSPRFWFDRHGGGPHCAICFPWPSKGLVSRVCDVLMQEDGSFAWEGDRTSGGNSGLISEEDEEKAFHQKYRCYEVPEVKATATRAGRPARLVIERRDWSSLDVMILADAKSG